MGLPSNFARYQHDGQTTPIYLCDAKVIESRYGETVRNTHTQRWLSEINSGSPHHAAALKFMR